MVRLAAAYLVVCACVAAPKAAVSESIRRIETLAEQEHAQARVDTRLRAAQLLVSTASDVSERLRGAALAELPSVSATRGIVMSLMALEPERGIDLLLKTKDKVLAHNQLVNYFVTRGQPIRAAKLLREGAAQGLTGLNGFAGVINAVIVSDPMLAVDLFGCVLSKPNVSTTAAGPPLLAGSISRGLVDAARTRPVEARAALRRFWALTDSDAFQASPGRSNPYTVLLNGKTVQVANSNEVIRLRLGMLAKTIDPETYAAHESQLAKWAEHLADVRTLNDVKVEGVPGAAGRVTPARFETLWAEIEQANDVRKKIHIATAMLGRADFSIAEKTRAADVALAALERTPNVTESNDLAFELENAVSDQPLGTEIWTRAARLFLRVVDITDRHPDNYTMLAREIDSHGLRLGEDHPSVQARLELARLGRLISDAFDFSLPTLSGETFTLKAHRGKTILLNFWATWCPPCRTELPILNNLHLERASSGIEVFTISDEEPSTIKAFLKEQGYTFPVLLDPQRRVFDHFRVYGIPDTKIFDRDGRMVSELGPITQEQLDGILKSAQQR